ncbi:MAG: hypothetical protein V5A59_06095 [Bacteroidales bacterium]|nr:hypothetical protein [Bacteroidales bacterium]MBS3775435.1 hypothetical protein [Bacteroidales bacterium]
MIQDKTYYHFFPFVVLYFFANNFLLPKGLLYTAILSPVFFYWLYKKHDLPMLFKWGVLLLIPIPFHLAIGVDLKTYIISTLLILTVWIFLFTAIRAVKEMRGYLDDMFYKILIIHSVLIVIALITLPFPAINKVMWDHTPISPGIPSFPRLRLLGYEPSHYGLLMSPVFIYFLLKMIIGKSSHPLITTAGIAIPLMLSLSFGVIGGIFLAMLIGLGWHYKNIPGSSKSVLLNLMILLVIILILLGLLWPSNPLFERIINILEGTDTSAKARLSDSFMFAADLVQEFNLWTGVGPGQVKVLAHDFITSHYDHSGDLPEVFRIPNSMAEMLAVYGIYGFTLKILIQLFFFVHLKIYKNLYSLILFVFIFIYQFTGSFLTNVAEVGIWVIAFTSRFPVFEMTPGKKEAL